MAQEWAFTLRSVGQIRPDRFVKKQPRNNTARTLARVDVMATSVETPVAVHVPFERYSTCREGGVATGVWCGGGWM